MIKKAYLIECDAEGCDSRVFVEYREGLDLVAGWIPVDHMDKDNPFASHDERRVICPKHVTLAVRK